MIAAIHHVSFRTCRVCLGAGLGVLVRTLHFHNCICCGKRSTYSHFRLWFINPGDSSQCTHSFIAPVTLFFPQLPSFFLFFYEHLGELHLQRKARMIWTLTAARSRLITSKKCCCSSLRFFLFVFFYFWGFSYGIMDAKRKITLAEYLLSFLCWIT